MPLEIRLINVSEYNAVNVFFNKARNINRPAQKTTRKYNEFCWEFMNGPMGKQFMLLHGMWMMEKIRQ
jgi:hypothetical protein